MMKNIRPEEETKIKSIRNIFRLEKEIKGIEDRIIVHIKDLFEEYCKPVIFGVTIKLNIKVKTIDIKHYQLKNILIKIDNI